MAKKDVFEKLNDYYTAIMDIDKIKTTENIDCNNECRLDRVLVAIKDIPKRDLVEADCNIIIDALRHSLVELYKETYKDIEDDIFHPEYKEINKMGSNLVSTLLDEISGNKAVQEKFKPIISGKERGVVYGAAETD